MAKRTPNPEFIFSRQEIGLEFDKTKQLTKICNKCKNCYYCSRAEYIDFKTDRKYFCTSNENVDSWKKRLQGRYNRRVIQPIFNY